MTPVQEYLLPQDLIGSQVLFLALHSYSYADVRHNVPLTLLCKVGGLPPPYRELAARLMRAFLQPAFVQPDRLYGIYIQDLYLKGCQEQPYCGRSKETRTPDFLFPKQALYHTELRPDKYSLRNTKPLQSIASSVAANSVSSVRSVQTSKATALVCYFLHRACFTSERFCR